MISGEEIYELIMAKIRLLYREYRRATTIYISRDNWRILADWCEDRCTINIHSSEETKSFNGLNVILTDIEHHLDVV